MRDELGARFPGQLPKLPVCSGSTQVDGMQLKRSLRKRLQCCTRWLIQWPAWLTTSDTHAHKVFDRISPTRLLVVYGLVDGGVRSYHGKPHVNLRTSGALQGLATLMWCETPGTEYDLSKASRRLSKYVSVIRLAEPERS